MRGCADNSAHPWELTAFRLSLLVLWRWPGRNLPRLNAVQVMANGGLRGLGEVESQTNADEDGEAGIILIAQLLGLFLTFLGEATTLRLIEDLRLQVDVRTESATATAATTDSEVEDRQWLRLSRTFCWKLTG